MEQIWMHWCRLCGNLNSEIDVFVKDDENFLSLAETIGKFLSVNIHNSDEAPTKVCKRCYRFVCDLISFFLRSQRVQEMFCDLQFNDKFDGTIDLNEIREKYGVNGVNTVRKTYFDYGPEFNINVNEDAEGFGETNSITEVNKLEISFSEATTDDLENECLRQKNIGKRLQVDVEKKSFDLNDKKDNQFKFERDHQIQRRINANHEKNMSKSSSKDKKIPIAECVLCNKKFLNKGGYTFHLKARHSLVSEPLPCKFCGKYFKSISDHQKHEATHLPAEERRTFPCAQCDKKFFSEANLNSHIKVVHVRQKSFICEECGKGYVTVDALNSHKIVHSDEKPFPCRKCEKSFKRLPTLKLHLESHENNKFVCSICGTQLNSRALLRRHMVVHSDKKRYKCNFCEKKFKRPDAFKHHLILHTGLKPYECPFCELTFANGSNCRKHQKTTHPLELAAAEAVGAKQVCKNVPKIEQLRAVNNGALNEGQEYELTIENDKEIILI